MADILNKLLDNISERNIAKKLDEETRGKLADLVKKGYDIDEQSRTEWVEETEEGIKIAEQVMEIKNTPWPGASNVKFPLIAISAIQFAARAYPSVIQGDKVVKAKVVGKDPDGRKAKKAQRVSTHMSWQLVDEMEGWDEDTDKLLHCLPVVGTMFRKTYRDELNNINASELCMPLDVVVHMKTKNFKRCRRVTHRIELYKNEVLEREIAGTFLDKNAEYMDMNSEEDLAELFLEQHRWYDLDGDGYEEPYVVTVHEKSKTLVRMVARYDETGIKETEKGKIKKIIPVEYFTPYFFIPSASGKFYAMGFAHLLGGINETLSTIINQLIDAGTLANTGGGFIGRGARMGKGTLHFAPNEWKQVDVPGGLLKDNIVPMPVKEPSSTLFSLLGLLQDIGMKLASVSETMAGESPSQNTPATTTLAVLEQGLKVFTAIYKRIYRSLTAEFAKLRRLNYLHMEQEEVYRTVLDDTEQVAYAEDYSLVDYDIVPVSDPSMASDAQRIAKAKALMDTIQINPSPEGRFEILKQYYEALQVPNMEKLLPVDEKGLPKVPQPPPDPKALELELKATQAQHAEERAREKLPLELTQLTEQIELIKAQTMKTLAEANSKPILDQLQALNAMVSAMHNETKFEIEREKIKGAVNGPDKGGGSGVGAKPDNTESSAVPGGGSPGDQGPDAPQLGGNGLGENSTEGDAGSGGGPGTQPYPPNVTRA